MRYGDGTHCNWQYFTGCHLNVHKYDLKGKLGKKGIGSNFLSAFNRQSFNRQFSPKSLEVSHFFLLLWGVPFGLILGPYKGFLVKIAYVALSDPGVNRLKLSLLNADKKIGKENCFLLSHILEYVL